MKNRVLLTFALLVIFAYPTAADDTDVYLTPNIPDGSRPLVMLQLDFRQNLSGSGCSGSLCNTLISDGYLTGKSPGSYTKFDVLRAILQKVLSTISGVEVGFMMSHEDSGACTVPGPSIPGVSSCSNGGFVGVGFGNVSDTAHFNKFFNALNSLPTPTSSPTSHWYQPRETHYEFFRYLTGQSPVNAHNSGEDHTGPGPDYDVDVLHSDPAIFDLSGNYISPVISACRKIYSVNFTDAKINNDDDSDSLIAASKAGGGLSLSAVGNATEDFQRILKVLYTSDLADGTFGSVPDYPGVQNLTSYFFASSSGLSKADLWAEAGGTGSAFSLDAPPDEIVQTLSDIFSDIVSTSATFVSASLPVNSFNRSEAVDHAYLALFEAQKKGEPTWVGNVKKLKIGGTDDAVSMVDALGATAVSSDGRIKPSALTFWTDPLSLPAPDPDTTEVANRDGRSVARGGAGQKIPGFLTTGPGASNGAGNRILYYDTGASLKAFNVDAMTASSVRSSMGVATDAEAAELIAYARGLDIDDLNDNGITNEARAWIMSDPLHSKPVVINYGARSGHSVTNPLLYIGAGTNNGFFHFIRSTNSDGSESGREEWAFMPSMVMGILKTLRSNVADKSHPYGVDGAATAYIDDLNHDGTVDIGEKVYLVFGLRRGGSAYYAMDVSNPASPTLKWSITATGDFSGMGLSFSQPRIANLNYGSGLKPVVIFGGGYDTNKDPHSVGTDDTKGNAIYIVDLETGNLIWRAVQGLGTGGSTEFRHPLLTDSIPSTISSVDTTGDGSVDRLLVGDTGGNIWRADLAGTDSSDWTLTQLAQLGRHDPAAVGQTDDRRFFHRLDVVQSQDENGPYDAVIIGSGDRSNPLSKGGSTNNYLFMIKDRNIAVGSATDTAFTLSALGDITDNCLQNDSCVDDPDLTHGWAMKLVDAEEKILSTPVTLSGTIYATSYIPTPPVIDSSTCTLNEGTGKLYAISLQNGTATRQDDPAYDPDYDPDNPGTDGRSTTLSSPGIPPEVVLIAPDKILRPDLIIEDGLNKTRWRTFWYIRENMDL